MDNLIKTINRLRLPKEKVSECQIYAHGYTDALNDVVKAIKNHGDIHHVSEPLGFFVFMGDRYYISEIDGSMLTGWRLTPVGMKHIMTISEDSVSEYVKSVR